MTDDAESYTQAEIVRLLKGLSTSVGDLRAEVHAMGSTFVSRAELTAWQAGYDREIKQLRDEIKPVKVSGWTIAAFGISAVVGLGSLLGLAITLMNVIP